VDIKELERLPTGELRRLLRDCAVIILRREDGDTYILEDEISEAVLIVLNRPVYCDIHG
jgi:hypothetical protein